MKIAIITDASAYLSAEVIQQDNVFVLDIPVIIEGETYFEGKNLTIDAFYDKMAASSELPSTSQPSIAALDDLLSDLESKGYTHVLGLFLSSGISGFWSNSQYLIEEHDRLTIAFPDTKITSAPLGNMVTNALRLVEAGLSFDGIVEAITQQIQKTTAYIMVDDLNHLVKGGRLSNGSALLGNLLSIKPILYFDEEGRIVVFEKVRTEKKAIKRLIDIAEEHFSVAPYDIAIIHSRAEEKAEVLQKLLTEAGQSDNVSIVPFNSVIATHLGEGAVALSVTPKVEVLDD